MIYIHQFLDCEATIARIHHCILVVHLMELSALVSIEDIHESTFYQQPDYQVNYYSIQLTFQGPIQSVVELYVLVLFLDLLIYRILLSEVIQYQRNFSQQVPILQSLFSTNIILCKDTIVVEETQHRIQYTSWPRIPNLRLQILATILEY